MFNFTTINVKLKILVMNFTNRIIINKPIVEVWNFYDNIDNMRKWLTGFQKFEHVSGVHGHPGAKGKHFYNEKGRTIILDEEILERHKYHQLKGKLSDPNMDCIFDTHFTDLHDGRTEMITSSDFTFKTLSMKLMTPFIRGSIKKRQDTDFLKLKNAIEEI
jgi:ligand-binding SRPBCC domain-containing protein